MRSIFLALILVCSAAAEVPYRFLLVAGDQWDDPASLLISHAGEFQITAALLKSWGLPFDVLRLDQQLLDRYHLLERDGSPRYGTIIWDAAETHGRDLSLLAELVAHGVSVVILGDTIKTPEIARLAGIRFISDYKARDEARFDPSHFITRPLAGREKELLIGVGYYFDGLKVSAENAQVVGRRGPTPFLTVREDAGRGRVAWFGMDRTTFEFQKQLVHDMLKRCVVWAQGYAVYAEYANSLILFMDDWGTSDKTYLPYWHYQTPTEDIIRRGLIEPLQKYGGVMDMNVNTGFVDRKTHRIVDPWQQRVVDELDGKTIHDFASTKRGLDAGKAAGVFSIESHGWTHMLPDLESAPGPFWDEPMDGAGSLDWYNEFGDALRHQEIPAITQRFHMRRAIECLREDFGVVPHLIRAGGSLYSKSLVNNTAVLAAQMGFGMATWEGAVYLSPDLVVSLDSVSRRRPWKYDQRLAAADVPWSVDGPAWLSFHDRDLSLDHSSVARLLDGLGSEPHYMTGAEYSGYLHAVVGRTSHDGAGLSVNYDDNYCDWFATHPSHWTIHFSDETRRALGGTIPETQVVDVPKGGGNHILWTGKPHAQTRN